MSSINKFGEGLINHHQYNNSKLKTNLLKTLGISINSSSIDLHKKRLCNLIAPIEPKDAVTKAYLLRKNDVLTDSVNKLTATYTSKMERIENDVKQFQNTYDLQMDGMKKQIDELYTAIKNDINSEAKQIELPLKNQLINANKSYMNKIEERFDKIEEYIFKWIGVEQLEEKFDKQLNSMKGDLIKLQTTLTSNVEEDVKSIEQSVKTYLNNENKEFINKTEERFQIIEDYLFKSNGKQRQQQDKDVKKRKRINLSFLLSLFLLLFAALNLNSICKRDIYNQSKIGRGFVNNLINRVPVELHLPGYQFCGPGTKLATRLAQGEKGINPLDAACREHDIAYSQSEDINKRHQADKILTEKAWQRVKSKDSDLKERINAWFVTNAMKAKVKFGLGMSASNISRKKETKKVRKVKKTKVRKIRRGRKRGRCWGKKTSNILKKAKPNNITDAVKIAQNAIHSKLRMSNKGNVAAAIPRIISMPKLGRFLPLVPILTALSALGGLATGGSAIVKTPLAQECGIVNLDNSNGPGTH
uniref:Phospholipase A2-like domain-containing protein n=1 Tax=Glossina morsitans morsitans TaxID=37546 RepID=A0A1B0G9Q6_GLOMM